MGNIWVGNTAYGGKKLGLVFYCKSSVSQLLLLKRRQTDFYFPQSIMLIQPLKLLSIGRLQLAELMYWRAKNPSRYKIGRYALRMNLVSWTICSAQNV